MTKQTNTWMPTRYRFQPHRVETRAEGSHAVSARGCAATPDLPPIAPEPVTAVDGRPESAIIECPHCLRSVAITKAWAPWSKPMGLHVPAPQPTPGLPPQPPLPDKGGYRDVDGDWVDHGHTDAAMREHARAYAAPIAAERDRLQETMAHMQSIMAQQAVDLRATREERDRLRERIAATDAVGIRLEQANMDLRTLSAELAGALEAVIASNERWNLTTRRSEAIAKARAALAKWEASK